MERPPRGWTPVEKGLWEAFRQGEVYDLRAGDDAQDDVLASPDWGPGRTVRAEVLARLLLAGPAPVPGRVASLKLNGAFVSGHLDLAGGTIAHYVELHHCRFERKVLVSEARAGTIRLVSCLIPRLESSRLATEGDLHLARCVIPHGIRLTDAKIGTDLLMNQAVIGGDQFGRSLAADGITVSQDFEAERLTSYGEISMRAGRINGRLSLLGAQLRPPAPDRYCLNLARISVGNTAYFSGSPDVGWTSSRTIYGQGYGEAVPVGTSSTPLRAYGGVRLVGARFDNACVIGDAEFHFSPDAELSLQQIQTPELLFVCPTPPGGRLGLSRARVGNLVDLPQSWPGNGQVGLTGFTYESLRSPVPFTVKQRIAWLDGALAEFRPEPYEQLAAALRRDGRDDDAREVQYAKERRRRATLPLPGRLWGRLQDAAVGYGYRPGRAGLWLLLAWALGSAYFGTHQPPPLKADEVPHWNPYLYALSKVLPVVDLSQDGWNPGGAGQWVATALVISGWVLATTVVTGATRMLQRG
ncbi:hypothetical protein GCM10009760_40090 [Kitasatospora kazusensis]|uniref:Oxidoreductase n=1 Tax=Kitasatospora kazusensis TaxID=407974 RepID=A0ABP5LJ50_9ACTN